MKKYEQYKSSIISIISIGIFILLFFTHPFFQTLNKNLHHIYYSLDTHDSSGIHQDIVIVEIDDASLEEIGSFPFSREVYINAIEKLSQGNPAVIGLDILFLDSSGETDTDTRFQRILSNYGNIVLGSAIQNNGSIQKPIFLANSGYLPPIVYAGNNTVYSFMPYYNEEEHFSLILAKKYYQHFEIELSNRSTKDGVYLTKSKFIPFSKSLSNEVLISFDGKNNFLRISLSDILTDRIDRNIFRDKIVIIGPAAEGFGDYFYTPNGREYGLHIHAHIVSTLLGNSTVQYFPPIIEWCIILCIIIVILHTNLSYTRYKLALLNLTIITLSIIFVPYYCYVYYHIIFAEPFSIVLGCILAILFANGIKYIIEDIHKKRLSGALGEYVGRSIVAEILSEQGKVRLDGEKRTLVSFFSDIEGFTSMSETLTPEQTVSFLRKYLTLVTDSIMQNNGFVDKFEGDAVMALWGAFDSYNTKNIIDACRVALTQQKAIKLLSNRYYPVLKRDIRVRVGIHVGEAIIGNIGAAGKKMEFTALGDSINTTSRLEEINKHYGTYICVSEEIYTVAKDHFFFRELDTICVKGKSKPVTIYELVGYKKDISHRDDIKYLSYMTALKLYRAGEFVSAKKQFLKSLAHGDKAAKIFIDRCEYLTEFPSKSWNGVWNMKKK